jgi:hypothetical protein
MRIGVALLLSLTALQGASPEFAPYESIKVVLDEFKGSLPQGLSDPNPARWNAWNRTNDQAIRSRLEQGALDSMVNLLLFGTSFTKEPRIEIADLAERARSGSLGRRVADLVEGLAAPNGRERLAILHDVLVKEGIALRTPHDKEQAGAFVMENLKRVLEEKRTFAERSHDAASKDAASRDAASKGDGGTLAERSTLFRDRGVSLDTGILSNFSIDLALQRLKTRGAISGKISRVAVIGPGMNFIDKDEASAFDYFPLQTVQPFAVIDSLSQLDLSEDRGVTLTVLDISPMVLGHFQRMRRQAAGYVIQLPQDIARPWPKELENYWRRFGSRIGTDVEPLPPPAAFPGLKTRAVRIRPEVVSECKAIDLNVVTERLELPLSERFDLVVATNIFLYYDQFQQALGLQNVAAMLNPGGLLLSNDELPLSPSSGMHVESVTAISDGSSGRDTVVAYIRR